MSPQTFRSPRLSAFLPQVACLLAVALSLLPTDASAAEMSWPDIRDGVVHLRMRAGERVTFSAQDAWGAEGAEDRLYFQAPDGEMLARPRLKPGEKTPAVPLVAARGDGDYRFEVTGFSHRAITLRADKGMPTVFEPAKVHFSIVNPAAGARLFFRVPEEASAFVFRARAERRGCNAYRLLAPSGKRHELRPQTRPYAAREHEGLRFAGPDREPGVWTLELLESGRAAFWLDGIPNLFAQRPDHLFVPVPREGRAEITVTDRVLGETTLLGVTAEAHVLTPHYEAELAALGPEVLHYYFFPGKKDRPDMPQRARIAPLPCKEEYILFGPTGRQDMIDPTEAEQGLRQILARPAAQGAPVPRTIVSFVDEPNLRLTLDAYLPRFAELRAAHRRVAPSLPLALPETALFMDGAIMANNAASRGADWWRAFQAKGLTDAPEATGGRPIVTWHEWMHRDLLATDYYADVVKAAAGLFPAHGPAPILTITQTNISPGSDTSSSEQDGFFASLWLAAAFAHGAGTGKLHSLTWLMFSDHLEEHLSQKGLFALSHREGDIRQIRLVPRPVLRCFKLLLERKLPQVLEIRGEHGDLALLATADADRTRLALFLVNTGKRVVRTSIRLPNLGKGPQRAMLTRMLTLREGDESPKSSRPDNMRDLALAPESVNVLLARPDSE